MTASHWISEYAKKNGIKTDLIPIDRFKTISVPPTAGKRLIGFCYPTHGFNLPWIMLKFIARFPFVKESSVFLLNTRGGSKIGSKFAPGISGIAQILPAIILLAKGFHIKGMLPLDMPSNWISIHPGFNQATASAIIDRCHIMVGNFCEKILYGRSFFRPNVFIMLPVDLALIPIAFLYFISGRFFFAKIFISSTDCNTCRLCKTVCPTASIKIISGRPFWKFTCESCMRCINICPRKSIQVSHSLAIVIAVTRSILPVAFIFDFVHSFVITPMIRPADFVLRWCISISTFFIVSGLAFWLLKVKWINKLFTVTSLTKYWRRYMAPGIKPKDYKNMSRYQEKVFTHDNMGKTHLSS